MIDDPTARLALEAKLVSGTTGELLEGARLLLGLAALEARPRELPAILRELVAVEARQRDMATVEVDQLDELRAYREQRGRDAAPAG